MNLRTTVSHSLALLIGAGLCLGRRSRSEDAENETSGPTPTRPLHSRSSPEETLQRRLNRAIETEQESREERTGLTLREVALEILESNKEHLAEQAETYQRLRLLADGFRHTPDLNPVLYQSLVDENEELATAIFLEWLRRDPDEAFKQFIQRGELRNLLYDQPIHLAIPVEILIQTLEHGGHSEESSYELVERRSVHLADHDDLAGFADLASRINLRHRETLIENFADCWIPTDGEEAARVILEEMPAEIGRPLMQSLNEGFPYPKLGWTDDFSAALLASDLGPCEDLRDQFYREPGQMDHAMGDTFYFEKEDHHYRIETANSEKDSRAVELAVSSSLSHTADYPELLLTGQVDIDEIHRAILHENPGLIDTPDVFQAELFKQLFNHAPEASMNWASLHIDDETMVRALDDHLTYSGLNEPRAGRMETLLEAIPHHLSDHDSSLSGKLAIKKLQVEEWRRLLEANPDPIDP